MQSLDFYQKHLNRVSRSFAFCIEKLDSPFREWTSLSYLLCRVLDTVEDSNWASIELRTAHYDQFDHFLNQCPSSDELVHWATSFPNSIPESETLLLEESGPLFSDLHSLSPSVRNAIQESVKRMSSGMRHFGERQATEGSLRLVDLEDVNRYCYFVAGVVGELLSKLYVLYRTDFVPPASFIKDAYHFGLFLQKVNLIKDQRGDEAESRYLVPDRNILLASLRTNAVGAVNYVASLPVDEKGFRTFCAWSLFLGAASLPWFQQAFANNDGSKISRSETQELLKAIEAICQDNAALRERLSELLTILPPECPTTSSHEKLEWFHSIRGASLGENELRDIGVF